MFRSLTNAFGYFFKLGFSCAIWVFKAAFCCSVVGKAGLWNSLDSSFLTRFSFSERTMSAKISLLRSLFFSPPIHVCVAFYAFSLKSGELFERNSIRVQLLFMGGFRASFAKNASKIGLVKVPWSISTISLVGCSSLSFDVRNLMSSLVRFTDQLKGAVSIVKTLWLTNTFFFFESMLPLLDKYLGTILLSDLD